MTRPRLVHHDAPPERLAALRVVVGAFALGYLVVRLPVFVQLREREAGFEPVGVLRWLDGPLPGGAVVALVVVALLSGAGFTAGAAYRVSGPLFAASALLLTTYRSSWGQLLHFENLAVLHLVVVGLAAGAADAWSVDARRRAAAGLAPPTGRHHAGPLRIACLVVVATYVIAGIAKLRYGGLEWVTGDSLRHHIGYAATRAEVLGSTPSPLAGPVVAHPWLFRPAAAVSVVIELAAPVALFRWWLRPAWVAAVWSMHLAIAVLMLIVFPYPLLLVAFAPFFDLERVPAVVRARLARARRPGTAAPVERAAPRGARARRSTRSLPRWPTSAA